MLSNTHLNLLRSQRPALPNAITSIESARLDPALDKPLVEIERDSKPFTVVTALVPRAIVEQDIGWRVEAWPGDVFDAVAHDVNKRYEGKGEPENVEVEVRICW